MSTLPDLRQAVPNAVPDFPLPTTVAWVRRRSGRYHLPHPERTGRTRCGAEVFSVTGGDQINFYDVPCATCFGITARRAAEISAAHVQAWNRANGSIAGHPLLGAAVVSARRFTDDRNRRTHRLTGVVVDVRRVSGGDENVAVQPPFNAAEQHVPLTDVALDPSPVDRRTTAALFAEFRRLSAHEDAFLAAGADRPARRMSLPPGTEEQITDTRDQLALIGHELDVRGHGLLHAVLCETNAVRRNGFRPHPQHPAAVRAGLVIADDEALSATRRWTDSQLGVYGHDARVLPDEPLGTGAVRTSTAWPPLTVRVWRYTGAGQHVVVEYVDGARQDGDSFGRAQGALEVVEIERVEGIDLAPAPRQDDPAAFGRDVWQDVPNHPLIGRTVTGENFDADEPATLTGRVVEARRTEYGTLLTVKTDARHHEIGEDHVVFAGVREDVVWWMDDSGRPRAGIVVGSAMDTGDPGDVRLVLTARDGDTGHTVYLAPHEVHRFADATPAVLADLLLKFKEYDVADVLTRAQWLDATSVALTLAESEGYGNYRPAMLMCSRLLLLDGTERSNTLSLLLAESMSALSRLHARLLV